MIFVNPTETVERNDMLLGRDTTGMTSSNILLDRGPGLYTDKPAL